METPITFVTSNIDKFIEARTILEGCATLTQRSLDLEEIQAIEVEDIIAHKLAQAYQKTQHSVLCEDTALHFEDANGFPGALIKWYLERLGLTGIAQRHGRAKAYAKTVVGYHDGKAMHFFTGKVKGTVATTPQGEGFGWDPIFIPAVVHELNRRSFAEMAPDEKAGLSMRGRAFRAFASYLKGLHRSSVS